MSERTPAKIGKYEVVALLGRGGMGSVYKALDPILNRPVAIKVLTSGIADDPELLKRFYREGQAAGSLHHPNIVTIYELGDQDGSPYLVMEYIDGTSLDSVARSGRQLSLTERISIMMDVCHGLDHAHQRGVVHRDIKPGNVMVPREGGAKIVDFGIAHIASGRQTRTGTVLGSMNYMAPEQVNGQVVDARSDIFSTGVVLYQLVTGTSPFDSDNPARTLYQILHEDPPPFTRFLSEYPPDLETVTFKALAKRPEERYGSAAHFAKDLSRFQDSGALPFVFRSAPIPELHESADEADTSSTAAGVPSATIVESTVSTRILSSDSASASERPSPNSFTQFFPAVPTTSPDKLAPPRVRLTFTASSDGLLVGRSVLVTANPFRIGREADLSIADVHLSREHAVIQWDGTSFNISDGGSTNGTYVDGRRLRSESRALRFGAIIRLGNSTVLTFSSDEIGELPDLTGQIIADRYQLSKMLRNGSKTALYAATDGHLPQQVAIKILSPTLARYPGYLEHFNREAEMAVRLRHPHICRVLDYGQTRLQISAAPVSASYLAAELMEGGSLAGRLASETPLELSQVISLLDNITSALDSAHRQGVVHGGLKLSSIVFDREGQPYVTDFGMASHVDEKTEPVFLGSPEFLSPEQWDGAIPTPLADQYSLAVMTYLMITGSYPFEGQLDPKVRERNFVRGAFPAHEEAARVGRTALPAHASEILKRGLAVTPRDRYSSVREFFVTLQHTLDNSLSSTDGKPRIFISYQRDPSSGWAVHFASELERKHEITAFVDTRRVDSSAQFPTRLKNAIHDCDVFVCLLSNTTLQSKWVQEEIRLAFENGKPMIPVFQEGYSPPGPSEHFEPHIETLINYDGVHLLDRRNLYVEQAIDDLAKMVTATVRKPRGQIR
jgi:serine/threonine protein kinase